MDFPYPFYSVQFQTDGTAFQPSETDALMNGIKPGPGAPTDLIVMSHGWNNNIDDATSLYQGLANVIKARVDANGKLAQCRIAICGLFWPSKKFEDADLIPSGAAALNDAVTADQLKQRVADLGSLIAASDWPQRAGAAPAALGTIADLMDTIEFDPDAQTKVVDLLRALLPRDAASTDDASQRFFETGTESLIAKLSKPLNPPAIPAGTGAASLDPFGTGQLSGLGGAASFRDVLGGIKSGFMHLLNYTTYYIMKARAGEVGVKGEAPLLQTVRNGRPDLRIHMIGHSFGCRVAAAAANVLPDDDKFRPDTMLLLQGAFSHNGFALQGETDRGAFRDVIEKKKVRGPILITHTHNDKAVGVAYPIASRISGVTAAALGDADDIYGGLGSNGTQTSQTTPEGVTGTLLAVDQPYPFASPAPPSTPFNLKADQFISGHSDVQKPEVGFAFSTAIAARTGA